MGSNRKLFGGELQLPFEARNLVAGGQYLKERKDYTCEVELRRASIQRGEHRLTTNQGLTLRERQQWFLTEREPIGLQAALGFARFESKQPTSPRSASIVQGSEAFRKPLEMRRLLSWLSEGHSTKSSPHAQLTRFRQPSA